MFQQYGFIYITTNNVNGKRYIGQCVYHKKVKWSTYLGSGKLLLKAIKKYGRKNFTREIICETFSKEDSNILEQHFIQEHNAVADPTFYNMALGGQVTMGFKGKTHTTESREKIRTHMLDNHPNRGKQFSDDIKQRMSDAKKGTSHHTPQQIEAVRKLGRRNAHKYHISTPSGEIVIVTHLRQFAEDRGIKYSTLWNTYKTGKPSNGYMIMLSLPPTRL